jgi:glycosyltransferase involved in cell wall biosynthesis
VSCILQLLGGKSYSIDPDKSKEASKNDFSPEVSAQIVELIDSLDFFRKTNTRIGMLHIGGSHDAEFAVADLKEYLPLMQSGGFIIIDDINRDSVRPAYEMLKEHAQEVFSEETYAILQVAKPGKAKQNLKSQVEQSRLKLLKNMAMNFDDYSLRQTGLPAGQIRELPKVSVVIVSYNQEKYIGECLEGILAQRGDFTIELVIGDDFSTDGTLEIINNYAGLVESNQQFEVKILPTDQNHGIAQNFKRCFEACTGDYVALCEGDDFWFDSDKLQKQISFMASHPDCSQCHHDLLVYYLEDDLFEYPVVQQELDAEILTAREIILDYTIGNFSCCMYAGEHIKALPDEIFETSFGDWMFNIYFSTLGSIGRIKEPMSVYRKHQEAVWSSKESTEMATVLSGYIDDYTAFFDFEYDAEFSLRKDHYDQIGAAPALSDMVIVDDFFPEPLSAFRMKEFLYYLDALDSIQIYSDCQASSAISGKKPETIIAEFRKQFPEHARQVRKYSPKSKISTKLFYVVFLNLAYQVISKAEELGIPLVFTLYPGGGFGINNKISDKKLRRVTSSPCFRKVIVTQQITYDYLLEKKFCKPEQIEFIFGGVVPELDPAVELPEKVRYGFQKETLDICFVAHNYTRTGVIKGYDVFIEVAHQLCAKYSNIMFHVVGGHEETDIDISTISSRFRFYGKQHTEWFDQFYLDKDIILSPNIPAGKVDGTFDGFPTGSVVDAGLRRVGVFCTDPLNLNQGNFLPDEEIVIIPHDANKIVHLIEEYYHHPEKLRDLGDNGSKKLKQVFSNESQILPRLKILSSEINQYETAKIEIQERMRYSRFRVRLIIVKLVRQVLGILRRILPGRVREVARKTGMIILQNKFAYSVLRKIVPASFKREYHEFKNAS